MDTTLIAAWGGGLSSSEVACLIGGQITASAVRSRRADLGLPPRTADTLVLGGLVKGGHQPHSVRPLPKCEQVPGVDPKPFAERGGFECAFVIAEDRNGALACCAPVQPGARRPYCPFHLSLTGAVNAA